MKYKIQFIVISLLFSTFFLSSCKKGFSSPNAESKQLFGTWEWVGSSGGSGGGMAESADNKHTLTFTKNRQMIKSQKGIKVGQAQFYFDDQSTSSPSGKRHFISVRNSVGKIDKYKKFSFIIVDGILYFSPDGCYDCYSQHYKRK